MDCQEEMGLMEAVEKEARRLVDLKYPQVLEMNTPQFLTMMLSLKHQLGQFLSSGAMDGVQSVGEIPLLVVFPNSMISYRKQLQLTHFDPQCCRIWLDRFNIPSFAEMREYSRPAPHLILDVEINGLDIPKEYSPIRAEAALSMQKRRGLSFAEGLALLRALNDRKETPPRQQMVLTNIFCSKNDDAEITMPCLDFAVSVITPVIKTVSAHTASARNNIVSCQRDFISYR